MILLAAVDYLELSFRACPCEISLIYLGISSGGGVVQVLLTYCAYLLAFGVYLKDFFTLSIIIKRCLSFEDWFHWSLGWSGACCVG